MPKPSDEEIQQQREQKRKERRRIAEAVLRLGQDEDFDYGISNAARVLAGSMDETIDRNDLQEHARYGELSEYAHQELKKFISKMADHQLLNKREVGTYAYVIEISNKGEEILAGEELPLIVLPRTVEEWEAANKSSDEVSYELFQEGNTPEEIADERDLKPSTIYSHLETFVEKGEVRAEELVEDDPLTTIQDHLDSDAVDLSGEVYLSNLKEDLPDEITYDEIKIVLSEYQNQS